MPQQPPASTIGKYQILGLLGEGAMGAVYRALDPVLQRPVAIKVMSDSVAREQELRERFLREAQAAGSLQHPNVVTIFDFGEVDGHLFIAMELLDGEDLETRMSGGTPLTMAAKLGIAIDVLSGLSYAHRRGIIHRDIKPANIRITEDERAKIMDFGVAHLTSQKMTRTGMTVGTPNYMAPEQITAGPLSPSTDVFSLGAVLYELLTHTKPFAAETLHGVMFKIVSEPTAAPSTLVPDLPPALDAIVARALTKDPAERYQQALDMANDLSALRAQLQGASPASSLSLNARFVGMTTPPVPVAAAAAPAPIGVIAGPGAARPRTAVVLTGGFAVAVLAFGVWALAFRAPSSTPVPASDVAIGAGATSADAAPAPIGPPAATPDETPAAPPAGPPNGALAAPARRSLPVAPMPPPRTVAGGRPSVPAPLPAASAAVQPPVSAPPTVASAATAAAPSTAPPAVSSPVREAPAPAAANAAGEIAGVVSRYARAIEARDVGAVRGAYPGLTPAQARNFEQFFRAVRDLKASFTMSGLDVSGPTADARLSGVYEFVTSSGQRERQAVSLQASFRNAGGSWELSAVR